jgi:putative transposase
MPSGLKRLYGQCDLHFVTFSCYHRRRYLDSVRAKNLFVQVLEEVRDHFDFLLVGYVLMPDHVHLLISEPKTANVSRVLQVLKQRVSRKMRARKCRLSKKQLSLHFGESMSEDRRFWQRRFYDFNVWTRKKMQKNSITCTRIP